ncbi:hypothetical protein QUF49_17710 [Fictibacillus sp. b24]|uniref:hypothetical protein n=1 Tax=Fictibacillus sp. b24 TaxID=3055863 RepID=UPI0025A04A6B|nr:hypothetical protein [Fictibacillus sp. b24]MDM5317852.1 hypothetical protein [Fictibacillus sp. b24]
MNTYYLEKMMEIKQREMEQLAAKESSRSHFTKKKNLALFATSLFSKKETKQSNQVCCA